MNRTHKTIFNRSLGVWQAVAETARSHGKGGGKNGGSTKATVALLLSAALTTAHAGVTDHGDGNFTVSGSFVPALPYNANGGSDSTPTITVDGTTNLAYTTSNAPLFLIGGANNYTVNVAAGAVIQDTSSVSPMPLAHRAGTSP